MFARSFLPVPVLQQPVRPAGVVSITTPTPALAAPSPAPDPLSASEKRYVYTLMGIYAVTFGVTSFFAYRAVQGLCSVPASKKHRKTTR